MKTAKIINNTKAVLNTSNVIAIQVACNELGVNKVVTKGNYDPNDSLLPFTDKDGIFLFMIDLETNAIF